VAIASAHPVASPGRTTTSAVTSTTASSTIGERLNEFFANPWVGTPTCGLGGGAIAYGLIKLFPIKKYPPKHTYVNLLIRRVPRPYDDEESYRQREGCSNCGKDRKDTTGEKGGAGKDTDEEGKKDTNGSDRSKD